MRKSIKGKTVYRLRMIRRHSGFTLIELMIVIFVIAVLAAIAVPTYLNYINKARVTVATSALSNAGKGLEEYHLDNGKYPASIDFANCFDDAAHRVFPSGLCDQMKEDLSIESYSISGLGYVLTARARDKKHTLLTLSSGQISQ